jgi:polysaccharide biosynthesis/export protein
MFRILLISLALICCQVPLSAAPQQAPPTELVQYVRDANKAGLTADQIEKNALQAGWAKPVVDQALELVLKSPKPATETPKVEENAKVEPEVVATPAAAAEIKQPEVKQPEVKQPEVKPQEVKPPAEQPAVAPAQLASPSPAEAKKAALAGVDKTMRDEYRIGEGDVLQISVYGEPTASVPSGVVRPDGMISMPLVKDIGVSGLTPAEAEKAITEVLSKSIKGADVTVIVSQIHSKKIFIVGGGVKKEGPISFTYRMTVMQAISEAGGLSDYAKRKKIYVLRNENGRQYKLPFNYDAVLNGEHMELNIPLQAGDTLVVPNH